MRATVFSLAASTILLLTYEAAAQDLERGVERYRIERTEDGFLRMDTRTGEISSCKERSGELTCRAVVAEEENVGGEGLAELNRRVDELERRLRTLEGRMQAEPGLPSEEEFERTMTLMERFLRRFWGVAKDLERESEAEEPARPPGRT